jgi:SPP1 family predicted phage head-tail adaptor
MTSVNMRHKVILQRSGRVRDEGGGFTGGWINQTPAIWAHVKPVKAAPVTIAGQPQQEITHMVEIRYRDDITKADRPTYRGRVLEIQNVVNAGESGKYLHISCIETGV